MKTTLTTNEKGLLKSVGKYLIALFIFTKSFSKLIGYAMDMAVFAKAVDDEK